jgi:hypothetical protein
MNPFPQTLVFAILAGTVGCGKAEPKPEPTKVAAEPAKPAGGDTGAVAPAHVPAPAATPAPAAVDPNAMGPDGFPAVIPAPGSTPPTVAEWDAVTKEVRVSGSSALGCETKMLREWLRVSCNQKGALTPTKVKTEHSGGQQAFVGMFGKKSSVVVQVVKGREYSAKYGWQNAGAASEATLLIEWPSDHERPVVSLK